MSDFSDMRRRLEELESRHLLRRPVEVQSPAGPVVRVDGRELICLCSNDYLGLADDPAVVAAARDGLERWGLGSGASRLVSGTMSPHRRLEEALAEFKGAEEAVLTSTGWMANHAAIGALAGPGDLLLCDKFNHASIIDAARACGARLRTFRHAEAGRLEELLERHRADHDRCLIVTDSLFSMDGDLAPLVEIVDLKHRYDARLLIDEAHATGVLGEHGRGVAEMLGVEGDVDVTVGTLSKALGGLGGFIAGAGELIDVIRNTSRPYIYTTAPPPALAEASLAALAIVRREPQRRRYLLELAGRFREALRSVGLDTGRSAAQIIPALVGPADAAAALSEELLAEGYLIPAIRPPTVPPGTSRLRISLSAGHCWEHLDPLVERLGRWAKEAKKFTP